MVWEIDKHTTKEEFDQILDKISEEKKKNDTSPKWEDFVGCMKGVFIGDPVEIQRKLREEWERKF